MRQFGRRRFLYCVGGVGALAGFGSARFLQPDQEAEELPLVKRRSWALGTTVAITVAHRNRAHADRAIRAAFDELELVEDLMSIYRRESQLSGLNRDRVVNSPHPYLLDVLRFARETSEKTGGAFDVTVQPLWELFATAQEADGAPSDAEIANVQSLVDYRRIEIGARQVRLRGDGTKVTFNGIAQGFAADRVAAVLQNHGIENALIDTGEIGALGNKTPSDSWTIGVQHPRDKSTLLSRAKLAGRCLATSGDYATSFSPDFRQHHLFDPSTGKSPTELSSVSIVAATAMEADALSTAVFVMGLDKGLELIRRSLGADAMFVTKEGRNVVTAGFPAA